MVTQLPNHWCASSWVTTSATRFFCASEAVAGSSSSAVSRYVMSPAFSMAPASKSGTPTWSSLPKAYGSPK
jgi:hypothetical protein